MIETKQADWIKSEAFNLENCCNDNPLKILGPHFYEEQWVIRVWMPEADEVKIKFKNKNFLSFRKIKVITPNNNFSVQNESKILVKGAKFDATKLIKYFNKKTSKNNLQNLSSEIEIDFKNINSKFDLIVSNPPYLSNEQFNNADPEVKNFEPKLALVGGDDGLKFYREYSNNLKNLMNKSAHFICEIGINQRQICEEIFENSGLYLNKIVNDLQGIERILSFSKI